MNTLPPSRRALNARTYSRSWNPCDFDPIESYPRGNGLIRSVLFVCAMAVGLALVLFFGLSN
mgnify:FL=1